MRRITETGNLQYDKIHAIQSFGLSYIVVYSRRKTGSRDSRILMDPGTQWDLIGSIGIRFFSLEFISFMKDVTHKLSSIGKRIFRIDKRCQDKNFGPDKFYSSLVNLSKTVTDSSSNKNSLESISYIFD